MASRIRLSYRWRLFLFVVMILSATAVCFVTFQYTREKTYKADRLDAQLQLLNMRLCDALEAGETPESFYLRHSDDMEGLRLTVVDISGRVVYDSAASADLSNHLLRKEIAEAIVSGRGYTVERRSESTDLSYFYSAMRAGERIVRSALPYNVSLREVLRADGDFFGVMACVALAVMAVGYLATRKLGGNISNLRRAAEAMDRGERFDLPPFADDELGEISEHIVAMYDRLRRANDDIEREHALALHEQQEKLRIKRQLTNNINHELKTPVAAIRGYLETILSTPDIEPEVRDRFLVRCDAQSRRLAQLLDDVSTLTRLDEGSAVISLGEVDAAAVVDEIASDMASLPEHDRMRLRSSLPHPLCVRGNASLVESIFRNLVDNAVAHSGGRDIFVSTFDAGEDQYGIIFADNGIGVDSEHIGHIFERFYRVDKGRSRKSGGTGLGLSIVKHAVQFHGGEISVANRAEGGLEFHFTLPRAR